MSQSPESAIRLQRYEDGWEIINRLIREDFSWGGHERKCLHVACDDGSFAEVSHAAGVDFGEDGRALAISDIDRDGRPDMLLRNRNSPQLRIVRNVWPRAGRSIWIHLEGVSSNRDAVGARVTMRRGSSRRVKEVQAGSFFLSQSSRWLCFGLGPEAASPRAEVRWPGGRIQDLGVLEPDRRYRVREGEEPAAENFRERESARGPPMPTASPEAGARMAAAATWLIDPLPAPDFALPAILPAILPAAGGSPSGQTPPREMHGPGAGRGKPLLLHFLAPSCAVCRSEADEMRRAEELVRAAGGGMVHVVADPEGKGGARDFLLEAGFTSPAVAADSPTLTAYNLIHRHLWNRRRDLAVPTTFLLDEAGLIVKVYRGRASPEDLAADIRRIPRDEAERLKLALPFEGVHYRPNFRRDLLGLGNAFFEAGLAGLARETFQRALGSEGNDVDSLFNYALSSSEAGLVEEAAAAYRKALELAPGLDDARNNLGTLLARAGRVADARALFESIVERNPAHAEAALNLGNTLLQEGRPEEAIGVYREALRHDPESAPFHRQLGYALYRSNDLPAALESYRKAIEIDPLDVEGVLGLAILLVAGGEAAEAKKVSLAGLERSPGHAHLLNALGMAHAGLGEVGEAVRALEKAIESDPSFDRPYLNLARVLSEAGRKDPAIAALRKLLAVMPDHPVAKEMLAGM